MSRAPVQSVRSAHSESDRRRVSPRSSPPAKNGTGASVSAARIRVAHVGGDKLDVAPCGLRIADWGPPLQPAVDDMNNATNPLTMCVWFNESPLAMQIMSPLTCRHAIFSTGFVAHDALLI
jgi:hypothetical protein